MTVTIEPSDVARKAAAYIREHGLAKEELALPDGSACFNGAIMLTFAPEDFVIPTESHQLWQLVSSSNLYEPGAEKRAFWTIVASANRILKSRYGLPRWSDVVQWNNQEERTAEEVAVLFDEIAEELSRD